ncbi:MAG: hypothetical protein HY929_06125 [Euryarchaeota archaeon]|nr:hypothetical protein [Euryarchaeota archaeon]
MVLEKLCMELSNKLNKLKLKYCVIRGYAGILYGSPAMTTDLDILIEEFNEKFLTELKKIGWNLHPYNTTLFQIKTLGFANFLNKKTPVWLHVFEKVPGLEIDKIRINKKRMNHTLINVASKEDCIISLLKTWDSSRLEPQKALYLMRLGKIDLKYLTKRAKEENVLIRLKWLLKQRKIWITGKK